MTYGSSEGKLALTGRSLNILITGVGGQGLITLATLLAETAINRGVKALIAETHGLSQRGGSVEVHVRLGEVKAPLIPQGGVDVLLGLELIETARRLRTLSEDGVVLTTDIMLRPGLPGIKLPDKTSLIESMKSVVSDRLIVVPASKLAREAGSLLYANTVMLGALAASGLLDGLVNIEDLKAAVARMKRAEENMKAFQLGFDYCATACRRGNP